MALSAYKFLKCKGGGGEDPRNTVTILIMSSVILMNVHGGVGVCGVSQEQFININHVIGHTHECS